MAQRPHVSGKSYDSETNERLRAVAVELVRRHGGKAARLAEAIGVSQATVSNFVNGKQGAGPLLAKKLAEAAGVTVASLTGEANEIPRIANKMLPGWPEATKEARRQSSLPAWTFELAGLREAIAPDVKITPEYAKAEAMLALQFSSEDEARRRTNAEIDDKPDRKPRRS